MGYCGVFRHTKIQQKTDITIFSTNFFFAKIEIFLEGYKNRKYTPHQVFFSAFIPNFASDHRKKRYLLVSRLCSPLCGVPNRLTSNLHCHPPLGDWHPYRHRTAAPSKPPNSRPSRPQTIRERYGRLSQLPPEASTATDSHPLITPTLKGGYRPGAEYQHEGLCPESANVT